MWLKNKIGSSVYIDYNRSLIICFYQVNMIIRWYCLLQLIYRLDNCIGKLLIVSLIKGRRYVLSQAIILHCIPALYDIRYFIVFFNTFSVNNI